MKPVAAVSGSCKAHWCSMQESKPPYDGLFLVFAPSADPQKPLKQVAWWSEMNQQWELLPKVWCDAITHWARMPKSPI